jgi:hypothetical protein
VEKVGLLVCAHMFQRYASLMNAIFRYFGHSNRRTQPVTVPDIAATHALGLAMAKRSK